MNKLPNGWELVTLKDCGIFFSGGTPLTNIKEFYKKEIPFITSSELNQKTIKKANKYISKKGYKNSSAKMIKKGDILLALYGATAGTIAISEIDGAINQAVLCIRFNKKINSKFFYYWFDLKKVYFVYKYTQGAQTNFNSEIIKNIQFSLPKSLEEQQKIAEILSEVDRSIELTKKIIEKEKRIKKGLMQDLLRYGIDENGNIRNPKTHKFKRSELGLIPKEWEVKKINEVCDILDNYRIPLNEEERQKRKGNIPYYGANGIIDFIDDYIFDDKLILLPEDGGDFENYKIKPIAYKVIGKCWVNNHAHVLKVKSIFDYDYVFYTLEHKDITYYISGGTRTKLNKSDLIKIKTSLPKSLEEQQKIAKILSLQDEKIEKLNKKLNKLEKIKKALMQDLLTGKVRVTKLLKDKK